MLKKGAQQKLDYWRNLPQNLALDHEISSMLIQNLNEVRSKKDSSGKKSAVAEIHKFPTCTTVCNNFFLKKF